MKREEHHTALVVREGLERFVLAIRMGTRIVHLRYTPSADEYDLLATRVGRTVRVVVEEGAVVGVYV